MDRATESSSVTSVRTAVSDGELMEILNAYGLNGVPPRCRRTVRVLASHCQESSRRPQRRVPDEPE